MAKVSTFTTKATPVDADSLPIVDSAASNESKRVLFSALKTWILTFLKITLASTSGPTQMQFLEDADNGTNKVTLQAPSTLASDVNATLPSATGTLALTSDIDAAVVGLLDDKGNQDCSANPNYPAASKGDVYTVSVAGKIGGASGIEVNVGDWFRCITDNAGGSQASVGSSWAVVEGNLVGAYVAGGTDVPVADGGTGASDAPTALANLGAVPKLWTVVSSASATVSPAASDSGKYYRLSHAAPTFNLPTTDLVVGETEFWLTFTGASSATGTVDAGSGKTVDRSVFDIPNALNPDGAAAQTATPIVTFQLFHIKYVATNTWASDLLMIP